MAQAAAVSAERADADHDNIVILRGVTWADYQRMLEIRGERSGPRITYLKGVLEIMSPSRAHELRKSVLARLVEAWCIANDLDITPYGSWTLENKEADRGAEPDECYVLGDSREPERPDLAIEIIWTSGGINKLEVYAMLRVREVWIWKTDKIQAYALRGAEYEPIDRSEVLPGIDLPELARFVTVHPMTRAVREYRATLRAGRAG